MALAESQAGWCDIHSNTDDTLAQALETNTFTAVFRIVYRANLQYIDINVYRKNKRPVSRKSAVFT
jgi:hypothetical protein